MWKAKRDYWLKWLEKLLRKYFGAMQTAQLALVFISQRHLQNWSVSRTSNNDDKINLIVLFNEDDIDGEVENFIESSGGEVVNTLSLLI